MLIVSWFKLIYCYSYVCLFLVGVFLYDGGLVNNSFLKALTIKAAHTRSIILRNLIVNALS